MRNKTWTGGTTVLAFLLLSSLSGCGGMPIQFTKAAEAQDGPRARLRVLEASAFIDGIPGKSCVDWDTPGAGTVVGGLFGSRGYRGRSLGIPGGPADKDAAAGLAVAANVPYTLVLSTGPESSVSCRVAGSFVPEADKDYEARMRLDLRNKVCSMQVVELGALPRPVPVQRAERCK